MYAFVSRRQGSVLLAIAVVSFMASNKARETAKVKTVVMKQTFFEVRVFLPNADGSLSILCKSVNFN